jgi:outer membrane receptor for ferrienterochelin and colicins
MKQIILALMLAVAGIGAAIAANPIREGNMISGHVLVKGSEENIPYATVLIVGSGQGTVSNEEGQFEFKNLPAGKYTLRVSAVGYKTQEKAIEVNKDFTAVVHFQMEEESFMTDEVVVSANRNEVSRKAAPVVVNVMSAKLFEMVNSTDLAKTLNYQSGLRVENNCQNCGFPQVRINGLEGPYSQILINSRPVISALSGVYGLEQIPVNMIERVEVVRGGGSAPMLWAELSISSPKTPLTTPSRCRACSPTWTASPGSSTWAGTYPWCQKTTPTASPSTKATATAIRTTVTATVSPSWAS